MKIKQMSGQVTPFIHLPEGRPVADLAVLIHRQLRIELQALVRKAVTEGARCGVTDNRSPMRSMTPR